MRAGRTALTQGLITSRRTSGNQRRYARSELRTVALIRVAQLAGIPLAEVGEVLAALPDRRVPRPAPPDRRRGVRR